MTASEALFAFVGWLTTRNEEVTFSARNDAGEAARLVALFIEKQGLEAPREGVYPGNITRMEKE